MHELEQPRLVWFQGHYGEIGSGQRVRPPVSSVVEAADASAGQRCAVRPNYLSGQRAAGFQGQIAGDRFVVRLGIDLDQRMLVYEQTRIPRNELQGIETL